jgi:hypothetical protein
MRSANGTLKHLKSLNCLELTTMVFFKFCKGSAELYYLYRWNVKLNNDATSLFNTQAPSAIHMESNNIDGSVVVDNKTPSAKKGKDHLEKIAGIIAGKADKVGKFFDQTLIPNARNDYSSAVSEYASLLSNAFSDHCHIIFDYNAEQLAQWLQHGVFSKIV